MKLTRKQRIDYICYTLAAFAGGFLFAFLASNLAKLGMENVTVSMGNMTGADPNFPVLVFSLLFGFFHGGIVSGVLLAARFFKRKSRGFKIAAALFSLITVWCVYVCGVFGFIPYFIVNLVKMCRKKYIAE